MAGERLGSAIAVRSAASPGGRVSFGGIEARFGPALPRIGFPSKPSSEVKVLPGLQIRNSIPENRGDSGKTQSSFKIIGKIGSGSEVRFNPDRVVNQTIRFQPHQVDVKPVIAVPEVKTKPVAQELSKPVSEGVEIPKVESKPVLRGRTVFPKIEPTRVERVQVLKLDVLKPVIDPVRRAQVEIMVQRTARLRARRVVRNTQAIPMVDSEALALERVFSGASPAAAPSEEVVSRVNSAALSRVELPKRNVGVETRKRKVGLRNEAERTQNFRKKFVEWDLEMNALRLKRLILGYEELKAERPDQGVDGFDLVKKSAIGSKELRSVILDQRGYKDRIDGSQRSMELFLASVGSIDKEKLKEVIDKNAALKDTRERPRKQASQDEMDKVFNPDRRSVLNKYEPVEVVEDIITTETRRESIVTPDSGEVAQVRLPEEQKVVAEVSSESGEAVEPNNVGILSSPFDLLRHNISEILRTDFRDHLINRREIVLN